VSAQAAQALRASAGPPAAWPRAARARRRTCRWGQAGSSVGSSSSGSKFSPSWLRVAGSARNRLLLSMKTMSSDTASVNLPCPVLAYSTSSSSVCRLISFSRMCRVGSEKSKVKEQRCSFCTKRYCFSDAGTSRKSGSVSE
jgi:hypothetical protein